VLAMTSQGVVKRWRFVVPYVPAGQNGEQLGGRDLYRLFAAVWRFLLDRATPSAQLFNRR
jgi:hypothetical protein